MFMGRHKNRNIFRLVFTKLGSRREVMNSTATKVGLTVGN